MSFTGETESWVLTMLLSPATRPKTELESELRIRLQALDVQTVRALVTKAMDDFLNEAKTKRNRHVLELLIELVVDINQCPYFGSETLLQRAIHGNSGKPDVGIAKALIKAGHSLTAAPPGGISPRAALDLMYGRPAYSKVSVLFQAPELRGKSARLNALSRQP